MDGTVTEKQLGPAVPLRSHSPGVQAGCPFSSPGPSGTLPCSAFRLRLWAPPGEGGKMCVWFLASGSMCGPAAQAIFRAQNRGDLGNHKLLYRQDMRSTARTPLSKSGCLSRRLGKNAPKAPFC